AGSRPRAACTAAAGRYRCYFHDIVSLPKNHPERSRSSMMAAEKTLAILQSRPSRKASASRIQPHSNAKRQLIKLACSS
ncbi:hypothetical protein FK521_28515, partial [Klebsiella pneumoniae]|nr:hypothetical protein [Klebsiella pneumoniae]